MLRFLAYPCQTVKDCPAVNKTCPIRNFIMLQRHKLKKHKLRTKPLFDEYNKFWTKNWHQSLSAIWQVLIEVRDRFACFYHVYKSEVHDKMK